MKKKRAMPDWEKFHRWEEEYEKRRLRKLTAADKMKIGEDLYRVYLKHLLRRKPVTSS